MNGAYVHSWLWDMLHRCFMWEMGEGLVIDQGQGGGFEGEEALLHGHGAGVACECSVGAHHAVAWEEEAHGVGAEGLPHGAGCCGVEPQTPGEGAVGEGATEGDGGRGVPHTLLEGCAERAQGHGEMGTEAAEVVGELGYGFSRNGGECRGVILRAYDHWSGMGEVSECLHHSLVAAREGRGHRVGAPGTYAKGLVRGSEQEGAKGRGPECEI